MQTTREVQQKTQLKKIEQDHEKVLGLVQTLVFGKDENRDQVADNRHPYGQVAQTQFELQIVEFLRQRDCRELSDDGAPPQPDHGAQANEAAPLAFLENPEFGLRHLRPFATCAECQNAYLGNHRA